MHENNTCLAEQWYKNPCYGRYWNHYNYVMTWCYQNRLAFQSTRLQYTQLSQYRSTSQNRHSNRSHHKKRHSGCENHRKSKRHRSPSLSSPTTYTTNDIKTDDQYEMHITEEMMDFLATSQKHREERDRKHLIKTENDDESTEQEDYIYVEAAATQKGQAKITSKPPRERPGVRRTAEMRQLYGSGAAMIHGMETAMQLTFNRNCDIHQPKMWPHMPLCIKFD